MTSNPFASIISPELKKLYNSAIDGILSEHALTVPCILRYSNSTTSQLCSNCIFDSISKSSANLYNGIGPSPFADNTICPVCMGLGVSRNSNKEEIIHMAVIFDSKYFLNWSSNTLAIPNVMVQTICGIDLYYKIKDANEVVFNKNIENLATVTYQRAGEPQPCGLGEHRYIVTLWKNK